MNLAENPYDRSAESGRTANGEYFTLYIACENLVCHILALPDGTRGIPINLAEVAGRIRAM